jgi:signal peptidase
MVGASAVLVPVQAQAAPFGRSTDTAVQLRASTVPVVTNPSCADANGSVVIGWSYAGDLPRSFTLIDDTGAVLATTTDGQARSATVRLTGALALGTQRTVRVQTNAVGAWTSVQSAPVTIQYTSILGLGSGTTCVR